MSTAERTLVLFPGALGDFLCCWPGLDARRAGGAALTVVARAAWLDALPEGCVRPLSIDRREIADLFAERPLAPETLHALGGHGRVESFTGSAVPGFAERLAAATGGRVALHRFRGMRTREHAAAYYARCLGVPLAVPRLGVRPRAAAWADALWRERALPPRTLVVHAGSGGAAKIWAGAAALAARWRAERGAVLWLEGPAERGRSVAVAGDVVVRDEPLDRVASLLRHATRYVGNDSGISHLAGLLGVRGAVVFGPSDARIWHPLGDSLAVIWGRVPCPDCGDRNLCTHRVTVEQVWAALG